MKFSKKILLGIFSLSAYAVKFLIVESLNMVTKARIYSNERDLLNDAQQTWDLANHDYINIRNKIEDAEHTITDGNCYLENISPFKASLEQYCQDQSNFNSSISKLKIKYNVTLASIPDDETKIFEVRKKRVCEFINSRQEWKDIDYNYAYIIHELRGSTAQGPGSNIMLTCGKFSYRIGVTVDSISSIGAWKTNAILWGEGSTARSDRTHTSMVSIENVIKGLPNRAIFTVDRKDTHLTVLAHEILYEIKQQCLNISTSFEPDNYYKNLISDASKAIAQLPKDLYTTKSILNHATISKDIQQHKFNAAQKQYSNQIIKLVFLNSAVVLVGGCFYLYKKHSECLPIAEIAPDGTFDRHTIQYGIAENNMRNNLSV